MNERTNELVLWAKERKNAEKPASELLSKTFTGDAALRSKTGARSDLYPRLFVRGWFYIPMELIEVNC